MSTSGAAPGSGGYEKSDLRPKPIVIFGVILTVVTVLAFVATYGMIRFLGWWDRPRLETPASPLATRTVPAEPRLQVDAPKELQALRATEEKTLASYGWVSKEAGIARIPIQRAMQLVLERGISDTENVTAPAAPATGGAQ